MVLKLLVFMVAVAVLEVVAGLQEKQFANETQIKANPDHKKRGRRLDKLPCIMEQGICQRKGDHCDGVVGEGAEWCLHHRHFECCYPKHCELNGKVYPNGAFAEQSCTELKCENGCWIYEGLSPLCGDCCASNTTDIDTYVDHVIYGVEISQYSIRGFDGPFSFSQHYLSSFGIDITFGSNNNIECVTYYEPGIRVKICCDHYPAVLVSQYGHEFTILGYPPGTTREIPGSDVLIGYTLLGGVCIVGSYGITVCVYLVPTVSTDPCSLDVCVFASPTLFSQLCGLCDVWIPIPPEKFPQGWTLPDGRQTTTINEFIKDWEYPITP